MPEINTEYVIELYRPSKHVGGIRHIAFYTCGFWRGLDRNLIALHSDVKSWNPHSTASSPTAPASPAGAPEVETSGYMIEQWVNNNRWRALYGPFETLEKAREVRERSKITPTRIVLQQKVVIEQ